jgi:hypothetical protein
MQQQQGNWKDQLALPARDERYRTEVRIHTQKTFSARKRDHQSVSRRPLGAGVA